MSDSRSGRVLGQLHHWLGSKAAPAEDGRLLERFVHQRDEDAFAELVARHGPLVLGLCRRLLGNAQDAEDAFQAVFFVLARKAASIRKPQSLSCWLHGVAYRLALRSKDEAKRRRIRERHAFPMRESEEIDLSWREVRGLLDEELQRLPEKQRLPLVLCYLEGLTQDEAARRLGWPRGTLKRRLEAGRERLRLRLTRRGVTLGAGLFAAALTESITKGAVPTVLRNTTVQASLQFLTQETAALAATPAMLLAKGVLQRMLTTKIKLGAMMVLLFGCVVTAAGLALPQALMEKQPKNEAEAPAPARPAEDVQARKDRYGDPLPPGAIARLGTTRLRHQGHTDSAVFTRDGKTVIVGERNGGLTYWDVATGREVRRLRNQATQGWIYGLYGLAISHDGKTLACGVRVADKGDCVYLWDVEKGKLLSQHVLKESGFIEQLLFTPDDKTLIVRDEDDIHLWDVASKKITRQLMGRAGQPDDRPLSPAIFLLRGLLNYVHEGRLDDMALSPDGKTLASCSRGDSNVRLWDLATGKKKLYVKTHDTDVSNLAYSPDGKTIVSFGNDPAFVFLDADTGKILRKVKYDFKDREHYGWLQSFKYTPDGKNLFCAEYLGVRVLDSVSGKQLRRLAAPHRTMSRLAVSPEGKTLATFSGQHAIELWDVATGKPLHPALGHRSYITSLVFSADGRQVFSSSETGFPVQVWDAQTGERQHELGEGAYKLALSPDGKLLAAGGSNIVRLWNPVSRKEVRPCLDHKLSSGGFSIGVDWSADGKTLVSARTMNPQGSDDGKTIRLWDAATGKERLAIKAKQEWGSDVILSPDGKIVANGGYKNGAIHLWSAQTGQELRSIATPQKIVQTLAFSPDGSFLVSGGESGAILLWQPATGRLVRQWETKANETIDLAFARDGRTLVSGHDDGSVRLWDVAAGKELACFQGHRGKVRCVAISRDGRFIASGGEDTTILVWDATGGARPDAALSAEQLRGLWEDLNTSDASQAYRAVWQLASSPKQALPFLAERLHPVAALDAAQRKQVDRLVTDLDNDQFAVRQQAQAELVKMGLMVEPVLRKALDNKPSLEVRQRIENVLVKLASERLRMTRALQAIEHMNTPEADAIRKRLAEQSVPLPQR